MLSSASLLLLNAGAAPVVSMAWTYAVMTQSLGLAMNNAVATEKNMQVIANSATSLVCARMLSALQATS